MKNESLLFDIKGSSMDDGPGIRTVVFFKGCPLSCIWCHNPESKSQSAELLFNVGKCIGCGNCIKNCTKGAVSSGSACFIDRGKCVLCFKCATNCPSGALEQVGMPVTIDSLMAMLLRDKPFFDASGGGVTLSGGESLMNMGFVSELLACLHGEGVHTLVETCGVFNYPSFEKSVLPHTDTVYMDIKLIDPDEHKRYCGLTNEVILKNYIYLKDAAYSGDLDFLPRIPLIPGITDTPDNLDGIAEFLQDNHWHRVQLLPYNPLWVDKYRLTGSNSAPEQQDLMKKFMPEEKIEVCREIFISKRITLV